MKEAIKKFFGITKINIKEVKKDIKEEVKKYSKIEYRVSFGHDNNSWTSTEERPLKKPITIEQFEKKKIKLILKEKKRYIKHPKTLIDANLHIYNYNRKKLKYVLIHVKLVVD